MSITDELREWAKTLTHWWYDPVKDEYTYTTGTMPPSIDAIRLDSNIIAIADRIDAEHESACAEAYGNGVMSVPIALDESAWVKLPKDADGVPIHVGERVQLIGNDPSTVSHMSLADDGWRVYVKYDGGIGTGSGEPKRIRHYHAPTVEDVLCDLLNEYRENECTLEEARLSEYAAKLRLAEEDA